MREGMVIDEERAGRQYRCEGGVCVVLRDDHWKSIASVSVCSVVVVGGNLAETWREAVLMRSTSSRDHIASTAASRAWTRHLITQMSWRSSIDAVNE